MAVLSGEIINLTRLAIYRQVLGAVHVLSLRHFSFLFGARVWWFTGGPSPLSSHAHHLPSSHLDLLKFKTFFLFFSSCPLTRLLFDLFILLFCMEESKVILSILLA